MDPTLFGLGATPLILALVQLAKNVGLPGRYAPLLSLFLGIAAGIGIQSTLPHPLWIQGGVIGSAIGLSASGLYGHAMTFASQSFDAMATDVPPNHALALIPLSPQDAAPPPTAPPDVVAASAEAPQNG